MERERVTSILIAGVGGQGTLLTSRVLAHVAEQEGLDVKVSEVHGMAQRGGSVVSQVRFGPRVYSPLIPMGDADVLLAFEKLEAARWLPFLKEGGLLIINDERVDPAPVMSGDMAYPDDIERRLAEVVPRTLVLDATGMAAECGSPRAANIVMVGVLARALGWPSHLVVRSLRELLPERVLETNLAAFRRGEEYLAQAPR